MGMNETGLVAASVAREMMLMNFMVGEETVAGSVERSCGRGICVEDSE